ncbi:MAG: ROK family transcriptional regulator [Asticcacaulis sp.]|nr:ROK family transcriptional regulator [Asticcacaulis sp.]
MTTRQRDSAQFRSSRPIHAEERDAPSFSGTNIVVAGDHNRRITLQAIRANGPVRRSELAKLTGLTPPAVFRITNTMLDEGLVQVAGRVVPPRGKPANNLVVNPDGAFALGLNIDRDHLTLVALDFAGRARTRISREIAFADPYQTEQFIAGAIGDILASEVIDRNRLIGVGVAMPDDLGSISLEGQPPLYHEWSNTRIEDMVARHLDVPVIVENDAAAAAIGELHFGHGLKANSFFYVLISAGLGGGLVINGQYFRGAHGRSGEIGFLPRFHPFRSRHNDPGKTLGSAILLNSLYQQLAGAGISVDSPAGLADLNDAGEACVDAWIDQTAEYLYPPLLTLMCGIDPDAVFIGGRLPERLVDRLCERVNMKLSMNMDFTWERPPVVRAAMAGDAAAIGAAILPFKNRFLPADTRVSLVTS